MEDDIDTSLVEERQELMVPPSGGNPTLRRAHFLKPMFHLHFPHPPRLLLPSNPNSHKFKKWLLVGGKSCPSEKWKLWVQILKPKYQEIWKKSGIYHAILASTCSVPRDKILILGLAEFWCGHTNTFVFPWGEVTITLEDILHLGCFSVLGSSFSTPVDDECVDIFNCLKCGIRKVKFASGTCVTPSMWMECYMNSGVDVEHEAFLACWLSKFVFGHSQILLQDLNVAIHLSRGNRIALAPIVLACIYRDMSVLHNTMVKSESRISLKFTTWHYDLVQMWVWERFSELRPKPNVIVRGEPRSARWYGVTKLSDCDVRTALNYAKFSFLWRPYAMIQNDSMLSNLYKDNEQWVVVESDAVESFARCLRASDLVGLGYIEQYFPHRVAMQFGLDQDIPPLVTNLALGTYDRRIRGVKLYIPPRLFESDVSSRYVAWWRGLVAVNEKMGTNSNRDKQILPLVSCGHKRNAESLATPGSLSGCVQQRSENGIISDQLKSRSGKPDSFDTRNDVDDDPVLNSNDNVEEDSLTITQFLNRSRKINNFENARYVGDGLVLDTVTSTLMDLAICQDATKKLNCMSEPVEPSVPIMPSSNLCEESKSSAEKQGGTREDAVVTSNLKLNNEPLEISVHSAPSSDKGKKRKSSTERQTEVEEDAVVTKNLRFTNEPLEISVHSMSSSDKGKQRKSSTERQTEVEEDAVVTRNLKLPNEPLEMSVHSMSSYDKGKKGISSSEKQPRVEEYAVVSPEDNIINLEEERFEDTTLESQNLGLKARIWRLEMILEKIKAAKFGASSTGNPDK